MQVLVLEENLVRQTRIAAALMEKGFHVIAVETVAAARCFMTMDTIDVMILGERENGRLSHVPELADACANPEAGILVLSDRDCEDTDVLHESVPQLYGIIGPDMAPGVVAQMALAAARTSAADPVPMRLAWTWGHTMAALPDPDSPMGICAPAIPQDLDRLPDPAGLSASLRSALPVWALPGFDRGAADVEVEKEAARVTDEDEAVLASVQHRLTDPAFAQFA